MTAALTDHMPAVLEPAYTEVKPAYVGGERGNAALLTTDMDRRIRRAAVTVVLVVAAAAAVLSYAGLRDLAVDAGISPALAVLLPLVVDGMILAGSLVILQSVLVGIGTRYGWTLTLVGVGVSVWGNMASVADMNAVAMTVHALPPAFLCLTLEAVMRILRHRIEVTQTIEAAREAEAAAEAAREAEVAEKTRKAAERAAEVQERAARRATHRGMSDGAAAMRAVMPRGDITLTEGAIAIVESFPGRLKSADVAAALGCTRDQAMRAVSRARTALKERGGDTGSLEASERLLAAV